MPEKIPATTDTIFGPNLSRKMPPGRVPKAWKITNMLNMSDIFVGSQPYVLAKCGAITDQAYS
ncbi:hypothetical protein OS42_04970 [Dickeya oryzae]